MSWAHYILQVNIYLVVFYGFYKLLLDKETYFILNRIYLVAVGVLSLSIPYLRFEWFIKQPAVQPVYVSVEQLMGQVSLVEETHSGFSTGNLIVFIYLIGTLFFASRFILQIRSLRSKLKQQESGDAFSFFWKKRIDPNLPQLDTVHQHEDTHIRQWHSMDVLFFEILSVFTWFNPIIYLYKNAVKSIHEYLADEEAAKFQGDKGQYALLLLSSAFGVPVNTLTNSFFNKSLIKKRIFMLHKQRSPKIAVLKYGLVVPLLAIALIMSSATIRSNEKIKEIANNIPLNTPIEALTEVVKESIKPIAPEAAPLKEKALNEGKVQAQPEWEAFYKFIRMSIRYPAAAQKDQIQGTAMIKFTIAAGQVENVGIATKLAGDCDAEALRRVVLFPAYKTIKDGNYAIKVKFQLEGANTPLINEKIAPLKGYHMLSDIVVTSFAGQGKTATADSEDKIQDFASVDTAPGFPGGMSKFYDYLKNNIKYPAEALEKNVQGKVYMSFVVEKDGSLADFKIERALGSGTDEEALRVMEDSPKWTPGTIGGKAVRVKYHLPIGFSKGPAQSITPENKQGATSPSGKGISIRFTDDKGGAVKLGDNPKNDPLVILDGTTIDMTEMKALDPNRIESISVVKDAKATATYGLKGANGVIVIRTKTNPLNEITIKQEKKDKKDQ